MIRVLVIVAVLLVAPYGCDQANSPVEKQEKRGGVEQAPQEQPPPQAAATGQTAEGTTGNIPIDAVVGESVETPQFDYRILDNLTTDRYFYLESPNTYAPMYEEAYSQAGEFVVLTYSVTNTSPQTVQANLGARLFVRAGGKVEVYEESRMAMHPYSGAIGGGIELAPRGIRLGQFIFDVPVDVEPETVALLYEDELEETRGEAGAVDITEANPQGPRPEEVLALQYEFGNMAEWEEAYELFAQESKDRVSLEQYVPPPGKQKWHRMP
jgi:hypothetical protein